MSNTYEMQVRFVVPDDMGEENVEHVLDQFLADVEETERFIEARIVDSVALDEAEQRRFTELMELVDGDCIEASESLIGSMSSKELSE